jgi:hypothetical protein
MPCGRHGGQSISPRHGTQRQISLPSHLIPPSGATGLSTSLQLHNLAPRPGVTRHRSSGSSGPPEYSAQPSDADRADRNASPPPPPYTPSTRSTLGLNVLSMEPRQVDVTTVEQDEHVHRQPSPLMAPAVFLASDLARTTVENEERVPRRSSLPVGSTVSRALPASRRSHMG